MTSPETMIRGEEEDAPEIFGKIVEGLKHPFSERPTAEAFYSLCVKMKERFDSYDSVLSDDPSGRLVALVFRQIINNRREDLGKEPVTMYSLPGGRMVDQAALKKEIGASLADQSLKKPLLVTEFIDTGRTIAELLGILEGMGIEPDVASVSIKADPEDPGTRLSDYREHGILDLVKSERFFYGDVSSIGTRFFNNELTGIQKVRPERATRLPAKIEANKDANRAQIVRSRQDAKIFANRLMQLIK
jgi:hypothetical protein